MPSKSRGLFSMNGFDLFSSDANKAEKAYKDINRSMFYMSDDGTGFLSAHNAASLAAHIKFSIAKKGSNLSSGYTVRKPKESYTKALDKIGMKHGYLVLTGELYDSIKLLNRRYGGGRGAVAGIDQKNKVEHFGWGGYDGSMISVGTYAYSITFGSAINDPHPLIPMAIEDYLKIKGPNLSESFFDGMRKNWEKLLSQAWKDRQSFGATTELSTQKIFEIGSTSSLSEADEKKDMEKEWLAGMRAQGIVGKELQEYLQLYKEFLQ